MAEVASASATAPHRDHHRARRRRQDPPRPPGRRRAVARRYEHGVWLIELAPVLDPEALPYALAATLGIQPQPMMSVLESVQQYLVERRALLILDNCEHLLEPPAGSSRRSPRACPGVKCWRRAGKRWRSTASRSWPLRSLTRRHRRRGALRRPGRAPSARASTPRGDDVAPSPRSVAPRRHPARHRARRRPHRLVVAAEIARRLDDRFRLLTGGRGPPSTPPDPAGHRRLELRLSTSRHGGGVRSARRLRRRVHPRGAPKPSSPTTPTRGCATRRRPRRRHQPRRQVDGRCRLEARRHPPLPAARDHASVRRPTPRRNGSGRRVRPSPRPSTWPVQPRASGLA